VSRRLIVSTIAVASLAFAACQQQARQQTLNGSGATFQKPYQEAAIERFTALHRNITINYSGGGSGKGRQDLADMVVDFAGSDSPFKEADLAGNKGGEVLYFPILLGPVAVCFNLEGVASLQLSAGTIARIFQRDVTLWNDPAIAADNPDLTLPAAGIVVVHRSDGSGTTDNFTKFLVSAAPEVWRLQSGSTVEWPAETQAGAGNSGIAQIVRATAGAVGYVDLSDAKASGLPYARVKNQAGNYVEPTVSSASAAGDGIEVNDDLTFSAVNAGGPGSYPITGQSWVIVYANQADQAKAAAIQAYVRFLVGDGQELLPELDFAPLPPGLQAKALAQVDRIRTS